MKEPPTEAALLLGKPKTRSVPKMKIQAGAYSNTQHIVAMPWIMYFTTG